MRSGGRASLRRSAPPRRRLGTGAHLRAASAAVSRWRPHRSPDRLSCISKFYDYGIGVTRCRSSPRGSQQRTRPAAPTRAPGRRAAPLGPRAFVAATPVSAGGVSASTRQGPGHRPAGSRKATVNASQSLIATGQQRANSRSEPGGTLPTRRRPLASAGQLRPHVAAQRRHRRGLPRPRALQVGDLLQLFGPGLRPPQGLESLWRCPPTRCL